MPNGASTDRSMFPTAQALTQAYPDDFRSFHFTTS
jgi:hypothetical protein